MADLKHVNDELRQANRLLLRKNKEILTKVKAIHKVLMEWSALEKYEFDNEGIDEHHFQSTGDFKMKMVSLVKKIYRYVMEEEVIEVHMEKMQKHFREQY